VNLSYDVVDFGKRRAVLREREAQLAPVPGLAATTAAGLARKFADGQWVAVETGLGDVATAALAALPPERAAALCQAVTIDLDTTDVEVYGSSVGWLSTTRASGSGAPTWPPGPRPPPCWPRT